MGGGYYEREEEPAPVAPVYSASGYSNKSDKILQSNKTLNKDLDPKRLLFEPIRCGNEHPIVFALDVTGSMGEWAKVRK